LIIASPLGVVIGYGLCAAFSTNLGWKWAFYVQAFLLAPSFIGLIFVPSKYFDIQLLANKQKAMLSTQLNDDVKLKQATNGLS